MHVALDKIKYEVQDFRKKKGVQKKISPEDQFMMAGIQPACKAKYIKNTYYLCVECKYEGCVCCVDLPDSRMPLTIVPLVNPACFGFQPPNNWQPYNLGFFQIDLTHHTD